ncbi:DUF3180 domain-containing protein [Cellulomonas bogoriensis]|uniref:DUF3180 domain-containing protein n=1 Tax=Cellulomonas bogoriensis 69B4 = DSM 16987 TaxID=1386082 RepID=A0A0A0BM64_9CELL|nr:DUF3180 domain-containing protein [Cellulomonas bogoriensis]KGM08747.1 hypothetical protein N869_09450 [Cellulomonas bogoriensis 69B4 = DSM 16987]
MGRTPVTRLLLLAAGVGFVSSLGLRVVESRGGTVLPVPMLSVAVLLGIAVVVLVLGWGVRQYARGRKPDLDPLLAARTLVLATAAAYTGALLTGWYGAHVLLTLGDLGIEARRALAVSAGVTTLGALGLATAGLVVERWCEVRPGDDEGPDGGAVAGGRM